MGGPFGFGGGGPFRRGPRVARGDVRAAILALLAEQPMHGYQIIGELHDRSEGMWKPSPGSVYPTLQQLEDEGLVTAGQDDGKRVFSLTEAGREVARQAGDGPAPWEVVGRGDAHLAELRDLAMTVGAAVMQVAHVGDRAHVEQAKKILEDTRRQLYRLLAGDTPTSPPDQTAATER
jgi:DNA-binding PadR family transcriptional regulator